MVYRKRMTRCFRPIFESDTRLKNWPEGSRSLRSSQRSHVTLSQSHSIDSDIISSCDILEDILTIRFGSWHAVNSQVVDALLMNAVTSKVDLLTGLLSFNGRPELRNAFSRPLLG